MDKVYVVTSGCYSSYMIEKIFSKREDAEQYCALQNKNDGWSLDGLEKEDTDDLKFELECGYKVEEYPLDDVKLLVSSQPIKRTYGYERRNGEEWLTSYGTIYANKSSIKVELYSEVGYSEKSVRVIAVLDSNLSMEQVKKIIRDEVASYEYEATEKFL